VLRRPGATDIEIVRLLDGMVEAIIVTKASDA
jgi:hypothetical protein